MEWDGYKGVEKDGKGWLMEVERDGKRVDKYGHDNGYAEWTEKLDYGVGGTKYQKLS